jgi:hypothetical protein
VFNEIPARFQDEFALVIHCGSVPESNGIHYEKGKIPLTHAAENTVADSMQVDFEPFNILRLRIEQTSWTGGYPRHEIQKSLMLFQDIEAAMAVALFQKDIVNRMKSQKKKQEFQAIFDQEGFDQKKALADLINERFGTYADKILDFEIFNPSKCRKEQVFGYRNLFTMDNWVKNDNTQIRLKAGRLLGLSPEVPLHDYRRSLNIYLPSALSFTSHISVHIPDGYQVKDISELNISEINETGSCKSTGSLNGNTINWQVSETFTNNFEPAQNWEKLSKILDALNSLSSIEIKLEKTKP